MVALTENSINCNQDNLVILNSNRNICFDFCNNFTTSSSKIQKFWTEDFYIIIKINLAPFSELKTNINIYIIDFSKPLIPITTEVSKTTSYVTTKINDLSM